MEKDSVKIPRSYPFVAKVKGDSIQTPRQLLALFKLCDIEFSFSQEKVDKLIELGFKHLLEHEDSP